MSGWLDWFEEKINCPHCGEKIIVMFCEDGDLKCDPVVVIGLAGDVKCKACGKEIIDEELS